MLKKKKEANTVKAPTREFKTKPCPDCEGKGIDIAVDDTALCAKCGGSGTIEDK